MCSSITSSLKSREESLEFIACWITPDLNSFLIYCRSHPSVSLLTQVFIFWHPHVRKSAVCKLIWPRPLNAAHAQSFTTYEQRNDVRSNDSSFSHWFSCRLNNKYHISTYSNFSVNLRERS